MLSDSSGGGAPKPVRIDAAATPTQQKHYYVYGASGRCWKFASHDLVQPYFMRLTGSTNPIAITSNLHYLYNCYGTDIDVRMRQARDEHVRSYGQDYEITIIGPDGKEEGITPRSYVFEYKKANIKIVLLANKMKYSLTDIDCSPEIPLVYLITKNEAEHSQALETVRLMTGGYRENYQLLKDYLLGDRTIYDKPRAAAATPKEPVAAAVTTNPVQKQWRRSLFHRLAGITEPSVATQAASACERPFTPLLVEVSADKASPAE